MKEWLLKKRARVIAAAMLVTAIPLLCLSVSANLTMARWLQQTALRANRQLAALLSRQLAEKLAGDIGLATSYATRPLLRDACGRGDRVGMARHLQSIIENSRHIERAFIASTEGVLLADFPGAVPSVIGEDRSSKDWFKEVSKSWAPYVSDYYLREAAPRRYLFAIAVPVVSAAGRPAGILVLQPKEDYVKACVDGLGATLGAGIAYVVDRHGNLVYHPGYVLDEIVDFSGVAAVKQLVRGAGGAEVFRDPVRNESFLAAYSPVGKWRWGVVVQTPARVAYEPARRLLAGLVALTLALMAGSGFLAYHGAALLVSAQRLGLERREEQERANKYLEVAGVMLVVLDTTGKVRLMNPRGCEILGYPAEQVVGRDWFEHFLPERLRAEVREVFTKLMRGEIAPVEYYENTVLTKDAGERIVAFHNAVLRDQTGEIAGILFSGEDITERKRDEELLRQKEAQLRESQRLAHIGSWEWDAVNDRIWWSEEYFRIYGLDPAKPTPDYEEHLKAYTPESARRLDAVVKRAMETGDPYAVDLELAQPTPETRWIVARGEARRDASGKIAGLRGTAQNITERKDAEERIRRANDELELRVAQRTRDLDQKSAEIRESQRALMNLVEDLNLTTEELRRANEKLQDLDRLKSMFIASMSHELRTPLNSIIGFSSILLEEWVGALNEEQKKNLATVLRSGKHLLSLINDVIDVSKIEAGKLEGTVEEFDLQDVVAEAAALLRIEAEQKGLVLEVDAARRIVRSDRRRLFQCLVNLIGNAVKFTESGRVRVRAGLAKNRDGTDNPDRVEIEVSDTGIGMREEDLGKLFSAFVRIASPLSARMKGTGLGLYLVKKIVEDILKGQVTVASTYGAGSRFLLSIPLSQSQGEGR